MGPICPFRLLKGILSSLTLAVGAKKIPIDDAYGRYPKSPILDIPIPTGILEQHIFRRNILGLTWAQVQSGR